MDLILDYFLKTENEHKSRVQFLSQEIERLDAQIAETLKSITDIEEGIDKSYSIFSSSQMANEEGNNEIAALKEMVASYENRRTHAQQELDDCNAGLQEVCELIETYKSSAIKQKDLKSITSKVQLALKVLDVDKERAVRQLNLALEQLKK